MKPSAVLAAAAALHEFTLGQVTAYCNGDRREVEKVLDRFGRFFETVDLPTEVARERRWRVADMVALRAEIARRSPARSPETARDREIPEVPDATTSGRSLGARLVLAEETLVDCGTQSSPAHRRVMARTAMNYLKQVVAAYGARDADWWEIDPPGPLPADRDPGNNPTTRSRIATDVALARMTACEAAGETLAIDYLIAAAVETRRLFRSEEVDRRRLTRMLERFSILARELTTPPGPESRSSACPAAPARLLSAVAWGRACSQVENDAPAAAQVLVDLLRGIARSRLGAERHHPVPLYQVLGRLPRGQHRVAVYTDLLDLLPRHFEIALADHIVPGALIEAVADAAASDHLRGYAAVIETDLVRSPFRSDSALIGQVAHVLQDLAVRESGADGGVLERTDRTRVELLSLAGVPV
jgi:hypothetical protein